MATEPGRAIEEYWGEMQELLESRGADALIAWIASASSDELRRRLFDLAQRSMAQHDWKGRSLEAYIRVAEAGINELVVQAVNAPDAEQKAKLTDSANVINYNMSAFLADCWEDDGLQRTTAHFERGLRAALDCLKWRRELKKGPGPFSLAHWAAGMHELALGHLKGAVSHFANSLEYAYEAALAHGKGRDVSADSTFFVINGHGYYGLALWAGGDELPGRRRYEEAIAAFEAQAAGADPEKAEDAKIGLEQLRIVKARYLK